MGDAPFISKGRMLKGRGGADPAVRAFDLDSWPGALC